MSYTSDENNREPGIVKCVRCHKWYCFACTDSKYTGFDTRLFCSIDCSNISDEKNRRLAERAAKWEMERKSYMSAYKSKFIYVNREKNTKRTNELKRLREIVKRLKVEKVPQA